MKPLLNGEIKYMFDSRRYGNNAVDSAAKITYASNDAADPTAFYFFHSGGAWTERPPQNETECSWISWAI